MLKDKIKSLLALSGKKMKDYGEDLGVQQKSIPNKLKKNSLNVRDLVILGQTTGSSLCYIKDGKVIMEIVEDDLKIEEE